MAEAFGVFLEWTMWTSMALMLGCVVFVVLCQIAYNFGWSDYEPFDGHFLF